MSDQPVSIIKKSSTLQVARVAWVILALVVIVIFFTSLPGYAQQITGGLFHIPAEQQTSATAILAVLTGLASIIAALLSIILAVIFYRHRFAEPMVAFLSFFLLLYAVVMAGPLETWSFYWLGNTDLALRMQGLLIAVPAMILFAIFPNGRFEPAWSRWLILGAMLWSVVFFLMPTMNPAELTDIGYVYWVILTAGLIILFGLGLYFQFYRYRHVSTIPQRQQTKWVMYGFVVWLIYIFVSSIPYYYLESLPAGAAVPWWTSISVLGWFLSLGIVPVSLAIAIMRHNLWNIDLVINRTLVYGALTALVIGIYVLVVGTMSALFQTQENLLIALIATGLVAVLFQPLRSRLQLRVNRMLYGQRDEPFEVLSSLGQQLEETLSPDTVYPTIVQTVAQALKLPYVALEVKKGERYVTAESYGKPSLRVQAFPLIYQGQEIGRLQAAYRTAEDTFSAADERILRNIARQAGTAVHAWQLTADLQEARRQIVTSREEERRRLRRDLHDGLGPSLAAQLLKIGSARALLADRPEMTNRLLAEMERDIENTLADVRRIVYELRPPALDQWGLAGALRAYAETVTNGEMGVNRPGLRIQVEVPKSLPPLPAAVEVAVYHIAREGLANVVRHAQAGQCTLRLAFAGNGTQHLRLCIRDDGRGISPERRAGVGLSSMRERTEELGGQWSITSNPGQGTEVTAEFPL